MDIRHKLRQSLSKRKKYYITDTGLIPAAVLVPIYLKEGQYCILFTRRTEKVKVHKGQISFPGGAQEEGDETLLDTALRECAEEINLEGSRVEILGELDDTTTVTSNYVIFPFVGVIPWPYQFKLDEEEVEEIIEAPIASLLDKDCVQELTESINNNRKITSYYYHYQGRVIWGATASILKQFLDIFVRISGEEEG